MHTDESVYLYAKDQAPLYDDVLKELESKTCPHTHTVYALLDVEEADIPKNMADHVSLCKECQKTVILNQAIRSRIDQLIPDFQNTVPSTLYNNNKQMLQRSEFSFVSRSKARGLEMAKSVSENFLDVCSVIFSVKMGLTYVAAVFIGLFLSWVL